MTLTDSQRGDLLSRWSEPHRRYHTVAHLTAVLAALDELAGSGAVFEKEPVLLAAWFHDAVYDPRKSDNEARSAALAAGFLGPGPLAEEVTRLVLLTADHRVGWEDANGAALCDADLAVLGGGPSSYHRYAAAVREEYAHVPDHLYCQGRVAVLKSLLGKKSIFNFMLGESSI